MTNDDGTMITGFGPSSNGNDDKMSMTAILAATTSGFGPSDKHLLALASVANNNDNSENVSNADDNDGDDKNDASENDQW